MDTIHSDKRAAFLKRSSKIPTQSGFLLEKCPLRIHADRLGKWIFFLPLCIAFVACFCAGCPARLYASEQLNRLDYDTALQKAKEVQRPLLVFFTTPWCYQCTKMKRKVFTNKDIISTLNEQFYMVEVDISQDKKLKDDFRIYYTPTSLFLDMHGKPIMDVKGYIPTNRLRDLLQYVSNGHYKTTALSDFEKN